MDINVVPFTVGNIFIVFREVAIFIIVKHISKEYGVHVNVVHDAVTNE